MGGKLQTIVTASRPEIRNQSLETFCHPAPLEELLRECADLDSFRRQSENLYERVRALFFLYAIHRFHLPAKLAQAGAGLIPFKGYEHLLNRRFEEAIECFVSAQTANGPSDGLSSALAAAYH